MAVSNRLGPNQIFWSSKRFFMVKIFMLWHGCHNINPWLILCLLSLLICGLTLKLIWTELKWVDIKNDMKAQYMCSIKNNLNVLLFRTQ